MRRHRSSERQCLVLSFEVPEEDIMRTQIPQPDAPQATSRSITSRRSFLQLASLGVAATIAAPSAFAGEDLDHADDRGGENYELTKGDRNILIAAEIAEALAVTTYTNIINVAPFFPKLAPDDQGYLLAARQEEMSHYLLEQSLTGQPSPFTQFFYPPQMFFDAQTTLNVLVTLEDAFIAAYLVGVRRFSNANLRVTAARIMGIESDHRALARVVGPNVDTSEGGPIETITGIQSVAESVDPPNNNGYERTLGWTRIQQAVDALTPFADITAAQTAGFDSSKSYTFVPFQPTLPSPLGQFHSFRG